MKKIKVSEVIDSSHSLMNDIVVGTANNLRDAEFIIKIDDLIKERGITQKDLAMMTGMRIGTISELVNGKGISFNKIQLLSLMVALRVTSFSDIFEIRLPEKQHSEYEQESSEWKADKEIPIPVKEMFRDNVLKANKLLK